MREAGSERCYLAGFKDGGKWLQDEEWGWLLEAGEKKETYCL